MVLVLVRRYYADTRRDVKSISYEELTNATNGFEDENIIGQGEFGYVHRGILKDGKEVAVKKLKKDSKQRKKEFEAEIKLALYLKSENLTPILGCCASRKQLIIVYPFCSNKTLKYHLHGEGRLGLDWELRCQIALGTAKGVEFLHREQGPKPTIIHRDVKTENILLDGDFNPRLADYGLAKFAPSLFTHVTTLVKGTLEYMDLDYFTSGSLTVKADVFSFGVVLLEIITGRKPIDSNRPFTNGGPFDDWVKPIIKDVLGGGDPRKLLDRRLKNFDGCELNTMIQVAVACINRTAHRRPSMSLVVQILEGHVPVDSISSSDESGSLESIFGDSDDDDYRSAPLTFDCDDNYGTEAAA